MNKASFEETLQKALDLELIHVLEKQIPQKIR